MVVGKENCIQTPTQLLTNENFKNWPCLDYISVLCVCVYFQFLREFKYESQMRYISKVNITIKLFYEFYFYFVCTQLVKMAIFKLYIYNGLLNAYLFY